MSDYESGYGNGKALGHAMHSEEALEAIRAPGPDETPEYRRGLEDGFFDGWDAWKNEIAWMQQGRRDLVEKSWDTRRGSRFKPPEGQRYVIIDPKDGSEPIKLPYYPDLGTTIG